MAKKQKSEAGESPASIKGSAAEFFKENPTYTFGEVTVCSNGSETYFFDPTPRGQNALANFMAGHADFESETFKKD